MDERSLIAWLAAGGAMLFVSVLLWRRSKPLSQASTRCPVLEKAMRLAMALAVGVLAGLVVLLSASAS